MKVVLFGATGQTGRCLIEQALAAGHEVTALVRNRVALSDKHGPIRVVMGDALDAQSVGAAIDGQNAVICALGTRNDPGTTVLSQATTHILDAMQRSGVRRIVCLTGAGVQDTPKGLPAFVFHRMIRPLFLRHVYADKKRQEDLVRKSGLDWVLLQPPRLSNGPLSGRYRIGVGDVPSGGWQISRADLADAMLRELTGTTHLCRAIVPAY